MGRIMFEADVALKQYSRGVCLVPELTRYYSRVKKCGVEGYQQIRQQMEADVKPSGAAIEYNIVWFELGPVGYVVEDDGVFLRQS